MPNKYLKHFLTQVIFQVNYNIPSLKTEVPEELRKICEELSKSKIQEVKNSNVNINFVPNLPVTTELSTKWIFNGSEIQIVIQHDFIQIVNLKYTNYSDFHTIICLAFDVLKKLFDPFFSRIAIRYVNNIAFKDGSTFDYNNLIESSLLSGLDKFKAHGLQRSVGQMIMKNDNDDLTTMFTYGFYNSQFPNKIVKREFLLDYDCFCLITDINNKIASIADILYKIRQQVNTLFEESISDGLRTIMNQNEPA